MLIPCAQFSKVKKVYEISVLATFSVEGLRFETLGSMFKLK